MELFIFHMQCKQKLAQILRDTKKKYHIEFDKTLTIKEECKTMPDWYINILLPLLHTLYL